MSDKRQIDNPLNRFFNNSTLMLLKPLKFLPLIQIFFVMTSQSQANQCRRPNIFLALIIFGGFIHIFILLSSESSGESPGKNGEEGGFEIRSAVYESLQCRQALAEKEIRLHAQSLNKEKTFLDLAKETKTSKVTDVKYQCMYEDALAPYRHVKGLKILEIGLGCGMPYGAGASYTLWTSYFRDPHITFFEYDITCGLAWLESLSRNLSIKGADAESTFKLPTIVYGDMTKKETLNELARNHGPWDIIIDDGCHRSECQISAFQTLFKDVNPGGIYFLEDLFAWSASPNDKTITKIAQFYTMSIAQAYAKQVMADLEYDWEVKGLGERLERLTCCDAICAFKVKV